MNELEQKVSFIEKVANDSVERYSEFTSHQQNRHQIDQLKEKNHHLKNVSDQRMKIYFFYFDSNLFVSIFRFAFQKIVQLQDTNKENETVIMDLKEKVNSTHNDRTPLKLNRSHANVNTPKTPKTPKTPALSGKENQSPSITVVGTMSPSILRIRNN